MNVARARLARPSPAKRALLAAVFSVEVLASCAGQPPPEARVRGELARGRWREAAAAAGDQRDEILRHLDRGLALLYAGDHRASNLHFARAEQVAEERYTRSVSRAALSLLLNDGVLPYQPDPLERLLVPLYRALNHVESGERQDAAVEARRLSALLLDRHDEEPERSREEGDAFLATVAGAVLQWADRPEDAAVAYRLASVIDPVRPRAAGVARPREVGEPLQAGDSLHGGLAELEPAATGPAAGELVLLVETGFVAVPVEDRLFLALYDDDLDLARRDAVSAGDRLAERHVGRIHDHHDDDDLVYLLPVALPRRPSPAGPRAAVSAWVDGQPHAVPPALDVSAAAAAAYDRAFVGLLAKTAARALAKTILFRELAEDEGWVVKVLANAIHAATERADTRAWGGLPDAIASLRLEVEPGVHDVRLRVDDVGGAQELDLGSVSVPAGGIAIVHARSFGAPAAGAALTAGGGRP